MSKRGRDYFLMSLARELGMTRRRLLMELDSYELAMWSAYFKEVNKPTKQKEEPEVLKEKLKAAFQIHKAKGKK